MSGRNGEAHEGLGVEGVVCPFRDAAELAELDNARRRALVDHYDALMRKEPGELRKRRRCLPEESDDDLKGEVDFMAFPVVVKEPRRKTVDRMRFAREEGLSRALGEENKGYRMLKAMGYKDGEGASALTIAEERRGAGLGVLEERIREREKAIKLKARLDGDFRGNTRLANEARAQTRATRRARSALRDLDERQGIESHSLWPRAATDEEVPLQDKPPLLQLRLAVAYLRDTHRYSLSAGAPLLDDATDGTLDQEIAALLDEALD